MRGVRFRSSSPTVGPKRYIASLRAGLGTGGRGAGTRAVMMFLNFFGDMTCYMTCFTFTQVPMVKTPDSCVIFFFAFLVPQDPT